MYTQKKDDDKYIFKIVHTFYKEYLTNYLENNIDKF